MSSYQYRDPHVKDERSHNHLIFNMVIPIPGKDGLYIEKGPCSLHWGILKSHRRPTVNRHGTHAPEVGYGVFANTCTSWQPMAHKVWWMVQNCSSHPLWVKHESLLACSGPVFCFLLRVSSDYAQPITGQVTEVTCPVIGRAQPELTLSKR